MVKEQLAKSKITIKPLFTGCDSVSKGKSRYWLPNVPFFFFPTEGHQVRIKYITADEETISLSRNPESNSLAVFYNQRLQKRRGRRIRCTKVKSQSGEMCLVKIS